MRQVVCYGMAIGWLALAGCGRLTLPVNTDQIAGADRLTGKLVVSGSSTVAPLVGEMAQRFEQLHPGVRIDVQTGGSGKGIADARNGVVDIGMASRELKSDESDLTAHPIAADGVCLIVHRANSVRQLSDEQVVAIYTGQITNWRQVGGADESITVVHKAEGRATLEVFLAHFRLENPHVRANVIVGDNEHAIKTVAGAPAAIGYVSIGTAEADVAAGLPLRLLELGGVAATTPNVASGDFPMRRPLNLVTGHDVSNLARRFIKFCQSEDVNEIIRSQYFAPLAP